ncbi:MAG TPA: hypothetical protein EYP85_05980 [Armatimonadetes bacterium]|nr:hypothetical protein [Armatimonadota bacterium]
MADIGGILPALFTPFDDEGEVSPQRLRQLTAFVLEQGVHGLFICGSTGEGVLLSPQEREQVAEIVLTEVAGQVPVIVHVGAVATRDAVRLAKHAARLGAEAVSSVPPFFFQVDEQAMVEHYRLIGQATDLPLYMYYYPALTGITLHPGLLDALLTVPHLVGLKFTDPDLYVMRNLIDLSGGRLEVLSGFDEMCLPAQIMGAVGAVGSTYNFLAPLFLKLYAAYRAGDWTTAQRCQFRANGFIRIMERYRGLPAAKELMQLLGVPCGPVRRPLRPLTGEERQAFLAEMEEAGLLELYS